MKHLLSRFKKDETATVTMEFVIIMPVLILWFIGSIVFFDAFTSRATAQRTAHTITDIISRQNQVDNAFIDKMLVLQNRMIPREQVGSVQVSSLKIDPLGNLVVLWSYATDGSPALTPADIPASILPNMQIGESVVLVDTAVPFTPIADVVGVVAQTWVNRVVTQPRYVSTLLNTDFP
jgi:Flp pilus assembly protein TadG